MYRPPELATSWRLVPIWTPGSADAVPDFHVGEPAIIGSPPHRPFARSIGAPLGGVLRAPPVSAPDQIYRQTALYPQKGGIPGAGVAWPVYRFTCSQAGARLGSRFYSAVETVGSPYSKMKSDLNLPS